MAGNTTTENHSFVKSLFLHLFPGLLIGAGYYALLAPVHRWGFPSLMALNLAATFILVPLELGYLLFIGRSRNGKLSLKNILYFQDVIPLKQYFLWVPLLFVLTGLIFTLFRPVEQYLQSSVFAWLPPLESGLNGGYAKSTLILSYTLLAVFGALIAPIVEELYFRGYLLPRMGFAGRWAPLLHSFLFALYHIWTPWMFVTRTFALLPTIYAIQKKNLRVGIITHCLINMIDVIAGMVFIVGMS